MFLALDVVVWMGFVMSWASATTQLNLVIYNLWWAELLLWGGLALIMLYARENAAEGGARLEFMRSLML